MSIYFLFLCLVLDTLTYKILGDIFPKALHVEKSPQLTQQQPSNRIKTRNMNDVTSNSECTVESSPYHQVEVKDDILLRHIIDAASSTITFELTYVGIGYVSLGFEPNGKMYPAIAVIGLPLEQKVAKFNMTGYTLDNVALISDTAVQSTLTNASIIQNNTHTVLMFTRPLVDPGDMYNIIPDEKNVMTWAVGPETNELAMHPARGSDSILFNNTCATKGVGTNESSASLSPMTSIVRQPTALTNVTLPMPTIRPLVQAPSASGMPMSSSSMVCSIASSSYYNVEGREDILLRHVIDAASSTITFELTYVGIGYVSLGFEPNGKMYPAIAVIGLPLEQKVAKFNMTGYTMDDVALISDTSLQSSITDSDIYQNETHTVLSFTRPFIDSGDLNNVLPNSNNVIIWAVGPDSNELAMHPARGSDNIVFDSVCLRDGMTSVPSVYATKEPSKAPAIFKEEETLSPENSNGALTLLDGLTATIKLNDDLESFTVELTYNDLRWISIAVSPDGKMAGSIAIIGSVNDNPPRKYDMFGTRLEDVVLVSTERQTLQDAEFRQNDTHTYMKFTKKMVEPLEAQVSPTGTTIFISCFGTDNGEAIMHEKYDELKWTPLVDNGITNSEIAEGVPNRAIWLVHGLCMALAWVVLIPCAIASSVFRKLIRPSARWFHLHQTLNILGICFSVFGFVIAFIATSSEQQRQHYRGSIHAKVGLLIFIFSIFQILNGFYKPPLPARPEKSRRNQKLTPTQQPQETDAFGIGVTSTPTNLPSEITSKSNLLSNIKTMVDSSDEILGAHNDVENIRKADSGELLKEELSPHDLTSVKVSQTMSNPKYSRNNSSKSLPGNEHYQFHLQRKLRVHNQTETNEVTLAQTSLGKKKSTSRQIWEIYHRLLGFVLVGVSWYNCHMGCVLLQNRLDQHDNSVTHKGYTRTLWSVIGVLSLIVLALNSYLKGKQQSKPNQTN